MAESSEVAFESSESSPKSPSLSSKSKNFNKKFFQPPPARSFRKNRGTNIQKLLAKENLEEEVDEFWQKNKYFGKVEELEISDDDYEKESSIKDRFDSDFISVESEPEALFFNPEPLEQDDKEHTLNYKSKSKVIQKPLDSNKKVYIHDFFTQEELLKEAALTEVLNKKSLEDLVRLEEEKKKKNWLARPETNSPKLKIIDSYKSGKREKILFFSDNLALEQEMQGVRNCSLEKKEIKEKKFKYRDPESKEPFNTVEELKLLRVKIQKEKKRKLKNAIKAQKHLLEKKNQALISFR